MLNTYRVFMFSVLNISSCKHSSGCLLLCIPSVFAIAVSTWGSPRNVDFSRPPPSTVETSASQVFDLNWKQTKTWIWGLDECSVFANLFPPSEFPCRAKGDREAWAEVPHQLSRQHLWAGCSGIPIWHWTVPISNVEMSFFFPPHGSPLWVPPYPLDSPTPAAQKRQKPGRD